MTGEEVINLMENTWSCMAEQYTKHPDESLRNAMNIVGKIVGRCKAEYENSKKEKTKPLTREELDLWIKSLMDD